MLLFVIGGSASGKSEYAELRTAFLAGPPSDENPIYYIATMQPYGEEAQKRIARHQALRGKKGFVTVERYTDLQGLCEEVPAIAGKTVLLECLSTLTANEMFDPAGEGGDGAADRILSGIRRLMKEVRHLVIVTADVFREGPVFEKEEDAGTREYIRVLAEVNRRIAEMADEVIEVVYSIPITRKGKETWCCDLR